MSRGGTVPCHVFRTEGRYITIRSIEVPKRVLRAQEMDITESTKFQQLSSIPRCVLIGSSKPSHGTHGAILPVMPGEDGDS